MLPRINFVCILYLAVAKIIYASPNYDTPCSNVQNAGGFTNLTEILEKLALLKNQEVMSFVAKAEQGKVASFDLFQCTYEYNSDPVIVATAICDASNLGNCVALATYANDTQCKSATLCDILNQRPSFTVDCSGIQAAYPSCELTCSNKTSHVAGMETCAAVMEATAPTAAPGSGSGTGNSTSSGTRSYLSLGSLAALAAVLFGQ